MNADYFIYNLQYKYCTINMLKCWVCCWEEALNAVMFSWRWATNSEADVTPPVGASNTGCHGDPGEDRGRERIPCKWHHHILHKNFSSSWLCETRDWACLSRTAQTETRKASLYRRKHWIAHSEISQTTSCEVADVALNFICQKYHPSVFFINLIGIDV